MQNDQFFLLQKRYTKLHKTGVDASLLTGTI
jgi:hypothetical protein